MTDGLTRTFAAYVTHDFGELPPESLREARRRLLDSIGVAFAALDHPGPVAVRRYAESAFRYGGDSTVWGTQLRVPAEVAALTNGVAVRYLDYSDNYFSLNGGHPSDIIGGLVALAEERGRSGRELLEAIVVGYEVGAAFNDTFYLRERGWDQTNMTGVAAWGGVVRLLGLTQQEAEDALAITVVPRAGMSQARFGDVAMWKGFAGPDAVRFAVYAGKLAEAGVQGPFQPFEGPKGFINQLLDGHVERPEGLDRLRELQPPTSILLGNIKAWPVGSVSQNAVSAAVALHEQLEDGEEVTSAKVSTFGVSITVMGSLEKYRPMTRETADHSLPYAVASALRYGVIDEDTYLPERFTSPEMHDFLQHKLEIVEDPELSARYPREMPARIEIETTHGRSLHVQVDSAPGSVGNPFTDEELEHKFRRISGPVFEDRTDAVIETVKSLEGASDIGELVRLLTLDR